MKRLLLVLLAPLLMSTQCEDDFDNAGFETSYLLQNDSSITLFLLDERDSFREVETQSTLTIGSDLNSETNPITPSESFVFSDIKLYKMEDENFILVYEQTPINNSLWEFNEPLVNRFEYTLIITDELID